MFKKILTFITAAVFCVSLAGCAAKPDSSAEPIQGPTPEATQEPVAAEENTCRIAGLKGPTTMGLLNLIEEAESGESEQPYQFTMYGAADEVVPLLIKGELDAAAIPANLAATLYQKTEGKIQVACINTQGVLYVVENGDTIHSMADLKGRTIVTTGKGTTPEYVLRYLLRQNALDPDSDVTIEYLSEATEVAARLNAEGGQELVAMLPQPFVTSVVAQSEGAVRIALDMNAEWETVTGTSLVTGVLAVRKEFAEENSGALERLLDDYKRSVDAAYTDVEGTAALCEKYGVVAKAALAQKALPYCSIVFCTGDDMKAGLQNYYQVLYDADAASVGGALPDDGFYYGVG